MKKIPAFLLLFCFSSLMAQKINIVPMPAEMKMPKIAATFPLTSKTTIVLKGTGLEKSAAFLNDYLKKYYGFNLNIANDDKGKDAIVLNTQSMDSAVAEAYQMTVNNSGVNIKGSDEAGVFYGIQTLIQLLPVTKSISLKVPFVAINDYPRF